MASLNPAMLAFRVVRASLAEVAVQAGLLESSWYRSQWGDRFVLTSDQNEKSRFENDKTGCRIALGVGGAATGEGGDRVVVDDPHNICQAESETIRQGTLDWWDRVMSTRLNEPRR